MCTEHIDIAVIGAGATGLAVARALALAGHEVALLEAKSRWGQGVSGRNSEVIHAGIYYPEGSLKARLCVEGNTLLREYLTVRAIPHSRLGKLIVGWEPRHFADLERIRDNAAHNGVTLTLLSGTEVSMLEPNIQSVAGLFSPTSSVFDSGLFLHALYRDFEEAGGLGFMNVEVTGLSPDSGGWEISGREGAEPFSLNAGLVINAAGLYADQVAATAGIPVAQRDLEITFCKGDYFSIPPQKARLVGRPVYPLPERDNLGIHITPDVSGAVKLGPDAYYIDHEEDYSVDPAKAALFFEAVHPFFPALEAQDLTPAMSGIRPKLQKKGGPFRDFHLAMDLPGLINCIGMESPGLTSCLATARHILTLL